MRLATFTIVYLGIIAIPQVAFTQYAQVLRQPAPTVPNSISPLEAHHHIGEHQRVCGFAVDSYTASTNDDHRIHRPAVIYLGEKDTMSEFDILIPEDSIASFPKRWYNTYTGKTICASGQLEIRPSGAIGVTINSPNQLEIVTNLPSQ